MNRRVYGWWLLAGLVALSGGCQPAGTPASSSAIYQGDYPLHSVATVGMVADLVRHVGGEHVRVDQIMGPGVDPHLYKPTRDDVRLLLEADVVFYSGLLLEGKMTDTLVKVGRSKPVYAVTDDLPRDDLLEPPGFGGHYDPHVWMDVGAWAKAVETVAGALSEFDPTHAAQYRQNAEHYQRTLQGLDAYARKVLATIPQDRRILITSHDAFNYFGRAYDLDVRGVQGISTESEAGLDQINRLVDLIVENQVKAVFVESSVPRKSIEALVSGARARGHQVEVGGELYSDAMGEAGTYEGTYVGMLDHNITTVARALGGEAPAGGMQGRLSHERSE